MRNFFYKQIINKIPNFITKDISSYKFKAKAMQAKDPKETESVLNSNQFSPVFDLSKQYASYANVLKNAKEGEVITRFPPEPSGYLHIGHVKAALLNFHYSRIYKGKMILRFDDTNPSKEKLEFVDSIMEDLKTLKIEHDKLTYTSDSFKLIEEIMKKMIVEGKAYLDNTNVEDMRKQRMEGIASKCRENTVEQNLVLWEKLLKGEADDYCVRGKIDMQAKNKCMRDPVFYRVNRTPHHRTGTQYLAYPTYDFACPIVDSIEGVTHCLRTNEYADRNEQYKWVLKATGLRDVTIYDFSRLNFVNTCLSKRKLQWFVDTKRVESWEDPRFPTLRGILRRGLRVETLIEFMLEQGPSKNVNMMEWDKIWAINKKIIDPISARFTAIAKDKVAHLYLINGPEEVKMFTVPMHQQNANLGNKIIYRSKKLLIESEDAASLKIDEKITLMKWGNVKILKIDQKADGSLYLEGEIMEEDKDFKSTKKINWVSEDSCLSHVRLIEYDHLIKAKKIEEDMNFEDVLNEKTMFITEAIAEPLVKNLKKGDIVQFERRGYFIVDRIVKGQSEPETLLEMNFIPDGRSKTASSLTTKVDVEKMAKGKTEVTSEKTEESKEKEKKKEKEKQDKQDKKAKKEKEAGGSPKKKEKGQKEKLKEEVKQEDVPICKDK